MAETKERFYIAPDKLISMVQMLQCNEPGAAEEIYNTFYSKIYGQIFKQTKDHEITFDLLQESFAEIYNKINNLREPAAFVSWANKIVSHKCAAFFRKLRKEERLQAKLKTAATIYDKSEQDNLIKIAVSKYMDTLAGKQKNVMELFYVHEKSVKQIAETLGIPEGTVKSRLYYGRKAVQKIILQQHALGSKRN